MEKLSPQLPTETLEEKRQYALTQCNYLIKDFAKRAGRHKIRYRRLQVISIVLAICTTILSALSASNLTVQIDWIVPAVSGLATLSTTLLSQTNAQRMWIQSRNIPQKFQMEHFLYLQSSGNYADVVDDPKRLNLFSKRLMEIWSQAQETWSQNATSGK
ncbi:MAG: DUF4231 domain-containing protein [Chloroflexota bacterium]